MTFDLDLIDSNSTKKRLLMTRVDDIVEKMKRIVKYVKAHAMKINKRMIARANANRKLIEYEIENHV